MEQKKIEHITLHLIVFGTIAIIGVLARQTVLHYGWDEFSSYLILVVCSIVIGAIYLNLQMAFRQLLSPTIERCFMRFECYRNKAVVVEVPTVNSELAGSSINSEPIISEPEPGKASAMACASTSASECPKRPFSYGICTPPKMSFLFSTSLCTS